MKIDSYVRNVAEEFSMEVKDGWGNENGLILQGLGMFAMNKKNDYDDVKRVLENLILQIPYECKYAGIACFYEKEIGTAEVVDRIKKLMSKLKENFDEEDDEMALLFYTKYETKFGGKEHYQDLFNRYKKAALREDKNLPYFMTAVIEGIESIDQAVYEYYDGLKGLFKNALKEALSEEDMDLTDKALMAFSILKACRLKVILAEKYESIGMHFYDEVVEAISSKEANKGAMIMMLAEKALH